MFLYLCYVNLNRGIHFLMNILLNNVIFLGKYGHIFLWEFSGRNEPHLWEGAQKNGNIGGREVIDLSTGEIGTTEQ